MIKKPKVRYSEFKVSWEEKQLIEVFSIFNGYAFPSVNSEKSGARWIKIADVGISEIKNDNPSYLPIKFKDEFKKFLLIENDIVVALTRPILNGKLKIAKLGKSENHSLLNQRVGKIETGNVLNFVFYILQKSRLIFQIDSRISGSDPPNLSPREINSLKIFLPSLEEQQKIADFLTSVDKKIQALEKKKVLLEQYKKGVMQKIFSQEIRFRQEDGSDYPEWGEKRLGEIGEIVSGLTYSPKNIVNKGVLVLRSSNIKSRRIDLEDSVYVSVEKYNKVISNDILICVRNGSKRLIGKNALISGNTEGVAFGAFMSIYRSEYNDFLFHYFDTDNYKKHVHRNLGATINSINGSDLKKMSFSIPSREEQIRIANFLSALDIKINKLSIKMDKTITWKKGLLQQMFV